MALYDQTAACDSPFRVGRVRSLDRLQTQALCRALCVFTPSRQQILRLVDNAKHDMPIRASSATILRVASSNPDCFWAIRRREERAGATSEPIGFVAFLMLSQAGRDALLSGSLDPASPEDHYMVGQHQTPAAVYVWALHARGSLTPALALVMDKLQSPNYRSSDFIARAATPEGEKFLTALGFEKRSQPTGLTFHHYERSFGPASPHLRLSGSHGYAAHLGASNRPPISAQVVHDVSELMQTISIRSAVYVGEEKCPYDEEFDGNDFSSTHIIGRLGNEPAGCLRIRYFSGFAKLERLAVRHEFRGLGLGREIVRYAVDLCRTKGYARLSAHVRVDKIEFWSRFGFSAPSSPRNIVFSDFRYIDMRADLDEHDAPITIGIDPYILLRREGEWDKPGLLEASQVRTFANQSPNLNAKPA